MGHYILRFDEQGSLTGPRIGYTNFPHNAYVKVTIGRRIGDPEESLGAWAGFVNGGGDTSKQREFTTIWGVAAMYLALLLREAFIDCSAPDEWYRPSSEPREFPLDWGALRSFEKEDWWRKRYRARDNYVRGDVLIDWASPDR